MIMWTKEQIESLVAKLNEVAQTLNKSTYEVAQQAAKVVFEPTQSKGWNDLSDPQKILCLQVYPQLQNPKYFNTLIMHEEDGLNNISFIQNGIIKSLSINDTVQVIVNVGIEDWGILPAKIIEYIQSNNINATGAVKRMDNSELKPFSEWWPNQANITTYLIENGLNYITFDNEGNLL